MAASETKGHCFWHSQINPDDPLYIIVTNCLKREISGDGLYYCKLAGLSKIRVGCGACPILDEEFKPAS